MFQKRIKRSVIKMFTFFLLSVLILNQAECLKLKQVVILSRHNVRTPLSNMLSQLSPKPWPAWKEKTGHLTAKGVLLEGFMGEYFFSWLNKEGFLPSQCPTEDEFFVYANTAQRTLASAKSFVKNAFPNCNITINQANKSDSIFNPYIHNTSAEFINHQLQVLKNHMKDLHLNSSYKLLEDILDYKNSELCTEKHLCDLTIDINKIVLKTGTKPNILGPIKISKSAIDSFVMENYEGFLPKEVAWGEIQTDEKWQKIMEISKGYHNIIFNSSRIMAKDIARPLIKYLTNIFINKDHDVSLIMGHDSNIYTVLNALDFKPYVLENQYEMAPAGGKVVFQKWADEYQEFLKVNYVYQGRDQMRDGVKLSLANPPTFHLLELKDCKINEDGFCLWSDFIKLLSKL